MGDVIQRGDLATYPDQATIVTKGFSLRRGRFRRGKSLGCFGKTRSRSSVRRERGANTLPMCSFCGALIGPKTSATPSCRAIATRVMCAADTGTRPSVGRPYLWGPILKGNTGTGCPGQPHLYMGCDHTWVLHVQRQHGLLAQKGFDMPQQDPSITGRHMGHGMRHWPNNTSFGCL